MRREIPAILISDEEMDLFASMDTNTSDGQEAYAELLAHIESLQEDRQKQMEDFYSEEEDA